MASRTPERYFRTPVTAPGPLGGDMLRAFGTIRTDPLAFLEQMWTDHGDVVQFPIPSPPTYLISSPEAVDRVLRVNQRAYGKATIQYSSLSLVTGEGLLTADTGPWRDQRRLVQPAFHHEQIEVIGDHVAKAADHLNRQWGDLPDGTVVDADAAMMHAALDVVGRALFGTDLSGDAQQLAQATLDALDVVVGRARNPLSPPRWFPSPGNRQLTASLKVLDQAVADMLNERRTRAVGVDRQPDMLDLLIEGAGGYPVAGDTRIRDQIITFLVAGHETVASALTWAWYLLDRDPAAMHTLQAEADSVLGNRAVTIDDYTRLPYARAVFDEALRLYPPAWLITRKALEPDVLDGHDVPAKALIVISPWLVHRHPDEWHEPQAFNPNRFIDSPDTNRRGYLPFGRGPRMCIGRDFALVEGSLLLAAIARDWNFEAVDSAGVVASPLVTVRPRDGLPMRIVRRGPVNPQW